MEKFRRVHVTAVAVARDWKECYAPRCRSEGEVSKEERAGWDRLETRYRTLDAACAKKEG